MTLLVDEHVGQNALIDRFDTAFLVPAEPLVGPYTFDPLGAFPTGNVSFTAYWPGPFFGGMPVGTQTVPEIVVVTQPVEDAMLADAQELGDPLPVLWTWPNLEILWRIEGSGDPWTVVQPTDLLVEGRSTAKPQDRSPRRKLWDQGALAGPSWP